MAKVSVSKLARNDLVSIRAYIQDEFQNPEAANRILHELRTSVESLQDLPDRGTPLDSILSIHTEYRFLLSGNYRIFYISDGNNVEVVRILHSLQDYMRVLFAEKKA